MYNNKRTHTYYSVLIYLVSCVPLIRSALPSFSTRNSVIVMKTAVYAFRTPMLCAESVNILNLNLLMPA